MHTTTAATYPLITAYGSARARGRTYGEKARDRIAHTLRAYAALFAHYAGLDWTSARAYARAFEPIIADHDPQLVEEMQGIAEGAHVDFDDILALNVRTEVMYGLGELHAAECTAFAALPAATADGHTLLGQNWDWHPSAFGSCVVLSVVQENRPSILTVVEAGLLAKIGVNSVGVGVATNALVSDIDRGEPGIPYHVVLRSILNSASFEEATRVVYEAPRASSANYLIATRSGEAIDLEAAPGGTDHVFAIEPHEGILGHANCFMASTVTVGDRTERLKPLARTRQRTIEQHLHERQGRITVQGLQQVLSDHTYHPNALCRHPIEELPAMDRSATVASVIMDLDTATLWVADGQPCSHPYREFQTHEVWERQRSTTAKAF
jgi:isopenicillin-N N-acyltransferase-like protein